MIIEKLCAIKLHVYDFYLHLNYAVVVVRLIACPLNALIALCTRNGRTFLYNYFVSKMFTKLFSIYLLTQVTFIILWISMHKSVFLKFYLWGFGFNFILHKS